MRNYKSATYPSTIIPKGEINDKLFIFSHESFYTWSNFFLDKVVVAVRF